MGNRFTHGSSRNVIEKDYEDLDMGIPGLFALLVMLLGYIKPAKSNPLQPICDIRVLDKYIREAKDAANSMERCEETCTLTGNFTLPKTNVSYREWAAKDLGTKAEEIQTGLKLLAIAVQKAHNMTVNGNMLYLIEKSYSNIRSVTQVVKSLSKPLSDANTLTGYRDILTQEWQLQTIFNTVTLRKIFQSHLNFLQGKVRMFFLDTKACNPVTS
ncbi:erythropoietin isoform X2 [Heptranchias perlo]|uniref:erythropoietin isoform X2 n=1 Tax=Heptranchias perlo TaxID=212740 RepID=UPI00355A1D48